MIFTYLIITATAITAAIIVASIMIHGKDFLNARCGRRMPASILIMRLAGIPYPV